MKAEIDAAVAALEQLAQAERGEDLATIASSVLDALIATLDPDHHEVLVRAAARGG